MPNRQESVIVRYSNGKIIKNFGEYESITYNQIPQHLIHALIEVEDANFFKHHGFDSNAIIRAFFKNLFSGKIIQGGSTITQQLVKVALLSSERSYIRKIRELMLAIKLENIFTKEQILTLYLNNIYFGGGNYGIAQASKSYFGKNVVDLDFWQSIILVSIIKAPSVLSPYKDNPKTIKIANDILRNMIKSGHISRAKLNNFDFNPKYKFKDAQNLYFANYVFYRYHKYLKQKNLKNIDIYTTLDENLQYKLNKAIKRNVSTHINNAAVTLNKNGDIVAMIGGKDYYKNSFNVAVNGSRQVGSIFKIFIFLAAFEQGWKIDDYIEDQEVKMKDWQPQNYNNKYHGFITLIDSFALSVNSSAIYLLNKINKKELIKTLEKFNFDFDIDFSDPTIALGTVETSPLEVAKNYHVFANDGRIADINFIDEIRNSEDKIIYKSPQISKKRKIIEDVIIYKIKKILRANIKYGTGNRANLLYNKIYGKTGTTQNHRDAWFVGFDNNYVTVVWSGKDVSKGKKISGGGVSANIFRDYYGNSTNY